MAMHYCEKCNKSMGEENFYTYKNGEKTELCKKCLTMHIDNFNPETFLWLLEKMDVPYIEEEWNVLRDKAYAKNPNLNGMSVFGKYLSKMKLKQWKDYTWADNERLKELREEKAAASAAASAEKEEMLRERLEAGEISESEFRTLASTPKQREMDMSRADGMNPYLGPDNPYQESNFISVNELPDPASELTHEDKVYLAMKWGRLYQPSEWVELEKMYEEMMNSFDIQDADTMSTLILICKTNLKMNQQLDAGDIEGFQKLSKVSESLRKTAKFTAAQNKEQKADFVDSVGELVALCEKEEGFIPRFCTDIPQDKVDLTLKDMNEYLRKLVTQDLGFGQQIEDAIKKIQIQKELQEAEKAKADDYEEEELEDENYEEFYEEIARQRAIDEEETAAEIEEE